MVDRKQKQRATAPFNKRRFDDSSCSDCESDNSSSHEHRDERLRSNVDEAEDSISGCTTSQKRGSDVVEHFDEAEEEARPALKRQRRCFNFLAETGNEESVGGYNDGSLPESSSIAALRRGPIGSSSNPVEDNNSDSSTPMSTNVASSSTVYNIGEGFGRRFFNLISSRSTRSSRQGVTFYIDSPTSSRRSSVSSVSSESSGSSYFTASSHFDGYASDNDEEFDFSIPGRISSGSVATFQSVPDLSLSNATSSDAAVVPTPSRTMTSARSDGSSRNGTEALVEGTDDLSDDAVVSSFIDGDAVVPHS